MTKSNLNTDNPFVKKFNSYVTTSLFVMLANEMKSLMGGGVMRG